jgi:hypothetical protein
MMTMLLLLQTEVQVNRLGLIDQAMINIFIGFGLALFNVLLRYFIPAVPRFISLTYWRKRGRNFKSVLILAYTLAFVLQVITSPLFRSVFQSVYTELGWSFYQAFFNLVGILIMDLVVFLWEGSRKGREQLGTLKERAAETLDEVGVNVPLTAEQRAAAEERREQQEQLAEEQRAERKRRIDDKLGGY